MSALEIQQLALDVFNNKLDYKDNDFIVIMALLKESYMRVKGILDDYTSAEKDAEGTNEEVDEEVDEDEEYFLRTHRYANYDSDSDSDSSSYTSTYLPPY